MTQPPPNTWVEKPAQFDIQRYINLIIRRKWLIVFTGMSILIGGFLFCLFTPLIYKASTLIVAVPQKVPETYIHSTINTSYNEQISSILQEITSRTSLEKIIKKFDLYPEMRKKYPLETVVESMKEDILIEEAVVAGKKSDRKAQFLSFNLSYQGQDPVKTAKVANALANNFVEKNLQVRTSQSRNTAEFLDLQMQKIYKKLKKTEQNLKDYKLSHIGELPEQTTSNIASLTAIQQQLQSLDENIRRSEDRAMLLRQQLSDERIAITSGQKDEMQGGGGASTDIRALSLMELKERLRILRSRYTDEHPDIVALKKIIKEREQGPSYNKARKNGLTGNPALDALKYQLISTQLEIKQMKKERKHLKDQIDLYQQRIENAPKREQEMIDLTRDYNNLKQTYDSLLQRKLEAEQAAALERRQQGAQFRIVDPAIVPEEPVKPQVKKLLPMIIALAFGGAAGLAFVLDFLSPNFYDPEDVTKAFGLPVLACIPLLITEKEQKERCRRTRLFSAISVVGYSFAFALLIIIFLKGPGAFSGLI